MPFATPVITTGTRRVLCPVLTRHFGKSSALILHQLHYWLAKENPSYGMIHDGLQWIRNSYNQWHKQIQLLSISTIRRAFSELESLAVIKSHHFEAYKNYAGGEQVKSYTIDYDILESLIGDLKHTLIARPRPISVQKSDDIKQSLKREGARDKKSITSTLPSSSTDKTVSHPDGQLNTPPAQMNTGGNIYISNIPIKHTFFPEAQALPKESFTPTMENASVVISSMQEEKEHKNNAEEMMRLWNLIIEQTPDKITLTAQRSRYLNTAFKQFFNTDMKDWEHFCLKIASSKFLMGDVSNFRIHLDWALKFSTLQRILEDGYSFGDRPVSYDTSKTALSHTLSVIELNHLNEDEQASKLRQDIRQKVGEASYYSWFAQTTIYVHTDNNGKHMATLYVASRFAKDSISTRFREICETYFDDLVIGIAPRRDTLAHHPLEIDRDTQIPHKEEQGTFIEATTQQENRFAEQPAPIIAEETNSDLPIPVLTPTVDQHARSEDRRRHDNQNPHQEREDTYEENQCDLPQALCPWLTANKPFHPSIGLKKREKNPYHRFIPPGICLIKQKPYYVIAFGFVEQGLQKRLPPFPVKETAQTTACVDKKEDVMRTRKPPITQVCNTRVFVSLKDPYLFFLANKAVIPIYVVQVRFFVKRRVLFCRLFYLLFIFMHKKKRLLSGG